MKHILVLTDFSDNAKQAAKNAVHLCEKLNTGLLLYHSYGIIPIDTYYPEAPFVTEEARLNLIEGEKDLQLLTATLLREAEEIKQGNWLHINQITGEGDLGQNVREVISSHDI